MLGWTFLYRKHQWISTTILLLIGIVINYGHGATIASSHLRHRQHGAAGAPPTRDDPDTSSAGVGNNSTSADDASPTPPSLQVTSPYRLPENSVQQHQEIILECDLNTTRSFNMMWLHDDVPVEVVTLSSVGYSAGGTLGHRYSVEKESGRLRISNARLGEDEGVWQCVDRDPQTRRIVAASKPTRIVVLAAPRSLYLVVDGRRLDPGNLFLPVKEDTELSVNCIVEGGHPAPTITWMLSPISEENTSLNTSADVGEARERGHTSSEARLGRVMRVHHNATITCVVRHVTLTTPLNASLLLDVQYSPSFGISRDPGFGIPLIEGMAVSLRCDVDSNPSASPVWVKDDGAPPVEQSGDGFLNFTAIRREHSGWYKCTSRHLLGEFSSIGYFLNIRYDPGEVTQDPGPGESTDVEVSLGGAVQLQCPSGVLGCWNRVSTTGRLEPVGPGPELTLDRVLYQEAGEYRCVAGQRDIFPRHWRDSHQIKLTVTGHPVVYLSNKTVSVITGQRLNLAVEFCANPPVSRALWLTATGLLAPGQVADNVVAHKIVNGSSSHCHQAMLSVHHVTAADQGEYVFLVRSPRGLAEGSVTVNVTPTSSFSVQSSAARRSQDTWSVAMIVVTLLLCVLHSFGSMELGPSLLQGDRAQPMMRSTSPTAQSTVRSSSHTTSPAQPTVRSFSLTTYSG